MREDLVLNANMAAKDVDGWDSTNQIDILLSVEAHFGIKFTTKEMDSLQNVGDLVQQILKKTESRKPG